MKRHFALTLIAAVSLTAAAATAGNKTFADAAGDSGTAPDLTSVEVTDTGGFVAFKIAGTLVPSSSFDLLIDTDRNRSTGDDGDDLWITVYQEADGKNYWYAGRWNRSKWEDANLDVVSRTYPGRKEVGFDTARAGIKGPFDFSVVSVKTLADGIEATDQAPDSIVPWTYELAARPTVRPVLGQLRLAPTRALAGKPLMMTVNVRPSVANGDLTDATTTCALRVGAQTAMGTGRAAGGWATCRLFVPKGASGKTARGSIVVSSGGASATRSFSLRVV